MKIFTKGKGRVKKDRTFYLSSAPPTAKDRKIERIEKNDLRTMNQILYGTGPQTVARWSF